MQRAATPRRLLAGGILLMLAAAPAVAQIEDQLSAYTGDNATGYMQPLADALGASLNDGAFASAHIPRSAFRAGLEVRLMGVYFGDDDRTFRAGTEGGFLPETTANAPTIVGDGDAVVVDGDGGAQFAFPGGLDLNSFALVVPQLRVGGIMGTEALLRWASFEAGDSELGKIDLLGIGLRHSISQYLPAPKFDLAAGFLWQRFNIGENSNGDDLISTNAFSIGAQASKRFGKVISAEPFVGLSMDTFSMDLQYEQDNEDLIDVEFEKTTNMHLTLGLGLNLKVLNLSAAYSIAGNNSFNLGMSLGNLGF